MSQFTDSVESPIIIINSSEDDDDVEYIRNASVSDEITKRSENILPNQIQEIIVHSNIINNCDKTNNNLISDGDAKSNDRAKSDDSSCDRIIDKSNCPTSKLLKTKITYSCHKCNSTFGSRLTFEAHYKQAYNEAPIYTCQVCNKQMKNRRSYQRHFNRHTNTKEFKCLTCGKTFAHEKVFKQHNTVHNLATAKCCIDCERQFFDLYEFKAHCRTHHDQKKKQQKWQCADCGKIMKNRSSLSMHMKIHANDRQFGCMICEQKFVQKINLINHVKAHNAIKTHSCKECGKSFVGQSQLMRHHTYHTNIRSFECEICKKMYKTKRDLKLHLMVHSVQRPHKCSSCEKTFLSTSKLKQHLNIHTGSRPYKCEYCPKDFTNFPNWLKHTRRRHKVDHKTGEKLTVMPKFLNKDKKPASEADGNVGKRTKIRKKTSSKKVTFLHENNNECYRTLDKHVKSEPPSHIIDCDTVPVKDIFADSFSEFVESNLNDVSAVHMSSSATAAHCTDTDLSTITVNDKTLPLNTSDDLERAASLLMQQTLDIEDEQEFINIKSELIDTSFYQNQYNFYENEKMHLNRPHLSAPNVDCHPPSHTYPSDAMPFFSYYPQTTQCDFTMMPLPPIDTVKSKLKTIDSNASHIYSTTANVL